MTDLSIWLSHQQPYSKHTRATFNSWQVISTRKGKKTSQNKIECCQIVALGSMSALKREVRAAGWLTVGWTDYNLIAVDVEADGVITGLM